MPTKTKEINEEKSKKTSAKKATATKKKATTAKATKAVSKKESSKNTKSSTKTAAAATKKAAVKKSTAKKANTTTKKSTVAKKASTAKKKTTVSNSSTSRKTAPKKVSKAVKPLVEVVEYYDLPYRYNETIVKILYQTPDTLFVYWDIADSDKENYIKQYGENFFNITRPVLIVHNETMKYSFELPINDFANSWYLHINDSKCNYRVELGRRPNYYSQEATKEIEENIKTDYIYVSSSNKIESPNDRVLFNTNENNTIKFRNIKNHEEKSVSLYDIVKHLPAIKKVQNIPYLSEELLQTIYVGIYQNEELSLFERIKSNPSSGGNPSSGSLSSRFI